MIAPMKSTSQVLPVHAVVRRPFASVHAIAASKLRKEEESLSNRHVTIRNIDAVCIVPLQILPTYQLHPSYPHKGKSVLLEHR